MNDIEKLFSEKITHHEVAPPPDAWDTLSETLRQNRRRRMWYWSAAAVLLLLGATLSGILLMQPPTETTLTQLPTNVPGPVEKVEPLPADTDEAFPVAVKEMLRLPAAGLDEVSSQERPVALVNERTVVKSASVPVTETKEDAIESDHASTSSQTLVVDASRYKNPTSDDTVSRAESLPDPSSVTVIYQPNQSTLAKKNSLGQRIDKTLTFIEDHGLGFHELRSAKSNLLEKVFSKEKEE